MKNEIRIGSLNKKIKVNDQGDTITLPFGDGTFENRYYQSVERITAKANEMQRKAATIDIIEDDHERSKQQAQTLYEFHKLLADELNMLFGPETCVKVFDGMEIPSYEMVIEFIEALNPFFEENSKRREKDLMKYSPERSGNA